jgi:hypothetical protein
MKKFTEPKIDVVEFAVEDVITTSQTVKPPAGPGGMPIL